METLTDVTDYTTEFFNLAAELNWDKDSDYDKHKAYIMSKYTLEQAQELRDILGNQLNKLYGAVKDYELKHCTDLDLGSDDGMSDRLNHAASLGADKIESFIKNPKLLEGIDYRESFSYCFPYDDDYKMLDLNYYKQYAKEIRENLKKQVDVDPMDVYDMELIVDEIEKGDFSGDHTYQSLYDLGKKVGIGCFAANIWSDGKKFYKGGK